MDRASNKKKYHVVQSPAQWYFSPVVAYGEFFMAAKFLGVSSYGTTLQLMRVGVNS